MKKFRLITLLLIATSLSSCQLMPDNDQRGSTDEPVIDKQDVVRALGTARKITATLKRNGSIYNNKKVTAYMQSVMNRLYPAFKNKIKVRVLNFSDLNAFALANGTIYFNLGLIARLENEAQLATVLGHEGAHYVNKHAIKRRMKIKSAADIGASKRSIYGYSRNLEREADKMAFLRLKKAGYDTSEAYKVFEHLAAEVKLLQSDKPELASLHPKLTERIASFKKLHARFGGATRIKRGRLYNLRMRKVKVADLEANLAASNYKSVILILSRPNIRKMYPDYYPYFLGEAYRLRGHSTDYNKAAESYRKSTRDAPQFAPAYNALGVFYLKQKKFQVARQYFKQYLKLRPQGKHAAYANHYIMRIDKKLKTGI